MHHILLSVPFDLGEIERAADRDERPRHYAYRVAQQLDATVHQPVSDAEVSALDRLLGRFVSNARGWAQVRKVAKLVHDGDVLFAGDEDALILAALCRLRRRSVRTLGVVTWVDARRWGALLKYLQADRLVDEFLVNTELKAARLRTIMGRRAKDRVLFSPEQTDQRFFTPGPRVERDRPLIFAAGREHRDYVTLAEAVASMDVDVKVCAMSPNAGDIVNGRFPAEVPANMEFAPFPWPEFRQAYRDADVVVVPTLGGYGSPGLTVAVEAMSCRRPVVITRTPGVASDFIDSGCVAGADLFDVESLRVAIKSLLADPDQAGAMAERGYERARRDHSSDALVDCVVGAMRRLGGQVPGGVPDQVDAEQLT